MQGSANFSYLDSPTSNEWAANRNTLREFIERPSNNSPGHDLPRNAWIRLNRLRSGWAKTASSLAKIGATDSEWCPCGKLQTVHHIINACPLFSAPSGLQGIKTQDPATRAWLESRLPLRRPLLIAIERTTTTKRILLIFFYWKNIIIFWLKIFLFQLFVGTESHEDLCKFLYR